MGLHLLHRKWLQAHTRDAQLSASPRIPQAFSGRKLRRLYQQRSTDVRCLRKQLACLKQSWSLTAVPPSRMLVELVSSATAQDLDALCDQLQCTHKYFHVFYGAAAAVRAGSKNTLLAVC